MGESILIKDDEFRLGLTMAGAITAGSYTGGVMDYMFELLELWEKAKKGEAYQEFKDIIPKHKVILDVMGGASAGGMTTAMAALYALGGVINPVTTPKVQPQTNTTSPQQNIFYDSWVLLNDYGKKLTSEQIWETEDMSDGILRSFLNSKFIDTICNRAIDLKGTDIENQIAKLPRYIAKDFELLISICSLRGIPFDINFTTPLSDELVNYTTYEHFTLAHFKLNNGSKPTGDYLWLNPFEAQSKTILRNVAIATGAFPFGLRFREFDYGTFTNHYLEETAKRIMGRGRSNINVKLAPLPKNFNFTAVDGGTVNNDPFGEVLGVLENRYGKTSQYGVIMIDPFPNFNEGKMYHSAQNLLDIPSPLLRTLREQATLKRNEVVDVSNSKHVLGMIYPKKWADKDMPDTYPIACASVEAFGGLLDVNFREHDYFLGRNNARNFFRNHFTFPYDPEHDTINPIHKSWTPVMIQTFGVRDEKTDKIFLPILPDLHLLGKTKQEKEAERHSYDIKHKPQYDAKKLFELEPAIKNRLDKIADILPQQKLTGKEDKTSFPKTDSLVEKQWGKSWLQKLGARLLKPVQRFVLWLAQKQLVNEGSKGIIKFILQDLEERGLLKK